MAVATETREPEVADLVEAPALPRVSRTPGTLYPIPRLPERPMFSDSLLDSSQREKRRRRFATGFSFVFQCLLISILLILPLMFTEVLPTQQLLTFLVVPPPPPPPPPAAQAAAEVVRQIKSEVLSSGQLRTPSRIPTQVQMIREEEAPPMLSTGGVVGGVPGGVPGGQLGGVIGGIVSQTSNIAIVPKLAPMPAKPIRVSRGVTEGLLVRKVAPEYPVIARQGRVQGQVILNAIISKTGDIENLILVSGHPLLVPAAIEAVKQWHYRPYLLNGEPVDVETTIVVSFVISQ